MNLFYYSNTTGKVFVYGINKDVRFFSGVNNDISNLQLALFSLENYCGLEVLIFKFLSLQFFFGSKISVIWLFCLFLFVFALCGQKRNEIKVK
jgi:hypothetical protein